MKTTIILAIMAVAFIASVYAESPGFFFGFLLGGAVVDLSKATA